ncbi:MAG: 2-octaprenylphenol hydroxylase [Halioglobus sp.]
MKWKLFLMDNIRHFDVVIVGSGIAGSALASALSGSGLSIALIEAQPLNKAPLPSQVDINHFDARVSALTPRSQMFLQKIDAWEGIASRRLRPYSHMTVWDAEGTGVIDFDCAEVGVPALGHIVENRVIVASLLQRVQSATDIVLLNPVKLESCDVSASGGAFLALDSGETIHGDLLVAADGAMSRIRTLLGFQTREWGYGHSAIVATVELERCHQNTAWQRFLPTGPLAFLPLPGEGGRHYCSIVWSVSDSLVEGLLALEPQDFCADLERAFEHRLGKVLACSARFGFPLRQRHAVDYVQAGVALVADAAHTIHPLAGQGINLGLADVAVLAEEILSGYERGASPGQLQLLKRYQRRRKSENLTMMAAMDGFKALFEQSSLPIRLLRNAGMRTVGRLGPLKAQLMHRAMGL